MQPDRGCGCGLAGGPGLDAWLSVSASLGTVAKHLADADARREALMASLHPVVLSFPPLTAAGAVIDVPDAAGPRWGWVWDVHRLTLAAPDLEDAWEGHVYAYSGAPSPVSLIDIYDAPGTRFYPKAGWLLWPHERVVLVAGPDFSGTAIPAGAARQVREDLLPEYLT